MPIIFTQPASPPGWDIANSTFVDSYDLTADIPGTDDIAFNPDGTKMYAVWGTAAASTVYEYDLTVAWDITSLDYNSVTFDATAQNKLMNGITFSPDGLLMFTTGRWTGGGGEVAFYQYDLGTAWDLSTATAVGVKSFDIQTQTATPVGIALNNDGTMILTTDQPLEDIVGFPMSAYDIDTILVGGLVQFDTNPLELNLQGIQYKSDGTAIFSVGGTNPHSVQEYPLGTAWDLSTATQTGAVSFDLTTELGANTPLDVDFNGDGTKMYVAIAGEVFEYNVP